MGSSERKMEKGESREESAVREIEEETGLRM
jgi:8-oxo-dGTP pyrophosphatase MutT (NUDIX family)